MRFFNIDKGLELPQKFNIMHNALDELFARRQELFQRDNPLMKIYKMYPLKQFQKTFGSSTGFKQAFEQTVDYASYPGFTNGDGFKFTVSYKPFSGKVHFTWQFLLESDPSGVAETLSEYHVAWQRQLVETGMFVLMSFFGGKIFDKVSKTYFKLTSADTVDGDTMGDVKNPIFTNAHTIVRREGMSDAEFNAYLQSNKYFINVKLDGTDPLAHAKIANGLYQIEVAMKKRFDDNGQRAGVNNRKTLISTEDAHLTQAIDSILEAKDFSYATGKPNLNLVKNGFDVYRTAYLDSTPDKYDIPAFSSDVSYNATAAGTYGTQGPGHAVGMLMLDRTYNGQNKGPIMVERMGFNMDVERTKDPKGVKYLATQAFDFFCPCWCGTTFIMFGNPADFYDAADASTAWANPTTFTEVVPVVYAKAVQVLNPDGSVADFTPAP